MPLWRIFHPANLYSEKDKAEFSSAITKQYSVLPDFYVVVIFTEVDSSSCFVGGKPHGKFVRINIDQIARRMDPDDTARMEWWTGKIEDQIAPWVRDHPGVENWEVSIGETSRDLWRIDGFIPPKPNSEGEKLWASEGKAVPYPGQSKSG